MKTHSIVLGAVVTLFSTLASGQEITRLLCPFEHGMGKASKEPYTWDQPDKKLIMLSNTDAYIRSGIDAKVLTVASAENGTYQVVLHHGDYYFWYVGVGRPLVSVGQNVKAGQNIANYTIGREVEFRMFHDEEALDPRPLLDCGRE